MLEALGYKVHLAADGRLAVELFQAKHASIDLVLLDVVMPGMGGPTAYEKMSGINPRLRALFVTGYTHEAEGLRSLARKGVSILQKPYSPAALGRIIRSLLDGDV